MRKLSCLAVLVVLVLTPFPCFAALYRSNAIGQKLELCSDETDIRSTRGFFLFQENDTSILYENGTEVLRTTEDTEGNFRTVTQISQGNKSVEIYENDLLVKTISAGKETNLIYTEGLLSYTAEYDISGERTLVEQVFFIRNAADSSLVAIRRYDSTTYIGRTYLFDNGELYLELSEGQYVSGDIEISETGEIIVSRNGIERKYSVDGMLLSEKDSRATTFFFYEDGIPSKSETITSTSRIVSYYEDGAAAADEEYNIEGTILSRTEYGDNQMIQTLFENGEAVARVHYSNDRKTVLKIEYI